MRQETSPTDLGSEGISKTRVLMFDFDSDSHTSDVLAVLRSDPSLRVVLLENELRENYFLKPYLEKILNGNALPPHLWLHQIAFEYRSTLSRDKAAAARGELVDQSMLSAWWTIDRVFLEPLAATELRKYFASLVTLSSIICSHIPQFSQILFSSTPHFPSDLTFARVAQAHGLVVLSLRDLSVPGRLALAKGVDFDEPEYIRWPQTWTQPNASLKQEPSPDLERLAIPTVEQPADARLLWLRRRLEQRMHFRKRPRLAHAKHELFAAFLRLWPDRIVFSRKRRNRIQAYLPYVPWQSRHHLSRIYRVSARKSHALYTYYESRAIRNVPAAPFVYQPYHFQPERTTDPEVGMFRDQFLLTVALRRSLDALGLTEMKILVREHPDQGPSFPIDMRCLHYRDFADYEFLFSIPGVQVVSTRVAADELLRKAVMVVTGSGTSAFEAARLGTPAVVNSLNPLSFGTAIRFIRDETELREAISKQLALSRETIRMDLARTEARLPNQTVPGVMEAASLAPNDKVYAYARMQAEALRMALQDPQVEGP